MGIDEGALGDNSNIVADLVRSLVAHGGTEVNCVSFHIDHYLIAVGVDCFEGMLATFDFQGVWFRTFDHGGFVGIIDKLSQFRHCRLEPEAGFPTRSVMILSP
jgi:hypothetical protein